MTPAMQYFVGKPVTIFTHPINRQFAEEDLIKYFVGEVQSVDNTGVLMRQFGCDRQSYFTWHGILGIVEEETFNPDDPKDMEKIAEMMKAEPALTPQTSPFIDIKAIKEMAQKAKKNERP